MSTYKSGGTVSVGAGSKDDWISFVPHGDYSVKHGGESYAVFLAEDPKQCIHRLYKDKCGKPDTIKLYPPAHYPDKPLKDTDLKASDVFLWAKALSAAMTYSKVEVEVEVEVKEDKSSLKLIDIIVPAK